MACTLARLTLLVVVALVLLHTASRPLETPMALTTLPRLPPTILGVGEACLCWLVLVLLLDCWLQ